MMEDNNFCIPLFDNEKLLSPAFIKSKRWIVNTCKEEILASSSKHVCFENLFQKKFKAVLTPSCSTGWQQIEFTNQKDKSIFLLTWL
jgi:hypothetical protein